MKLSLTHKEVKKYRHQGACESSLAQKAGQSQPAALLLALGALPKWRARPSFGLRPSRNAFANLDPRVLRRPMHFWLSPTGWEKLVALRGDSACVQGVGPALFLSRRHAHTITQASYIFNRPGHMQQFLYFRLVHAAILAEMLEWARLL